MRPVPLPSRSDSSVPVVAWLSLLPTTKPDISVLMSPSFEVTLLSTYGGVARPEPPAVSLGVTVMLIAAGLWFGGHRLFGLATALQVGFAVSIFTVCVVGGGAELLPTTSLAVQLSV